MALQKKKRNIILKLWKKKQLKILRNIHIQKCGNYLFSKIYNLKNLNTSPIFKYLNIFDVKDFTKISYFYILKKFSWFSVFFNDFKNINYSATFLKSHTLISFLLNFHDNILRDFSSLKLKRSLNYVNSFSNWNFFSIKIILKNIKRILKYFYIFLNYFSYSIFNYFLVFFSFFNKFNKFKSILYFFNYSMFYFFLRKKKIKRFFFDYLLFNKILSKNNLLYQNVKKALGKFFHKVTYKKNKNKYFSVVKILRKKKRWLKYRFNIRKFIKIFKVIKTKGLGVKKFYNYFLSFNIINLQRHCIYPKFLINTVILGKEKNTSSFQQLNLVIYKKKFLYFKDTESINFYNEMHIQYWEHGIFNIFNFKLLTFDLSNYIKKKVNLFQNNIFDNLIWSWHLITNKKKNNIFVFFNFKIKNHFLNFFYKIYKIRVILNYLVFLLLPLNLNLIWLEFPSYFNSKIREISLNILKHNVNKYHWFFDNRSYKKKISDFYYSVKSSYLKKKEKKKEKKQINIHVNKQKFKLKNYSFLNFYKKNNFFINKLQGLKLKLFLIYPKLKLITLNIKKNNNNLNLNIFYILLIKIFKFKLNNYYKKKTNYLLKNLFYFFYTEKLNKHLINFSQLEFNNFINRQLHNFNKIYFKYNNCGGFVKLSDYDSEYWNPHFKNSTLFNFLNYSNFKKKNFYKNLSKRNLSILNLTLYFSNKNLDIVNTALTLYKYELRMVFDGLKLYRNHAFSLKRNSYYYLKNSNNCLNNLFFYKNLFLIMSTLKNKNTFLKNLFFIFLVKFHFSNKIFLI